ncbi:MAG: hypothetical protein ABI920_19100 [Casimicrobiaceae bacterium]
MATTVRTPSDIHPCLTYEDATAAIEWLCPAFGFARQFAALGADGSIMHAEPSVGTAVVMVRSPKRDDGRAASRHAP